MSNYPQSDSGENSVLSWVCPRDGSVNRGESCAVCGEPCPKAETVQASVTRERYCPTCGRLMADGTTVCQNCTNKRIIKIVSIIVIPLVILFLLFVFFDRSDKPSASDQSNSAADTYSPAVSGEPSPDEELSAAGADVLIDEAQSRMASGDFPEAAAAIFECLSLYSDPEVEAECDSLLSQMQSTLKGLEPETGTELERTFQFQGGSDLIVTAESGPAEMTVVDVSDPSKLVRFYIRQGETATIHLPSQSSYEVSYKIGYVWFDDETGFGDFYQSGDWGVIECEYSSDNSWITNSVWTGTV